MITNFEKVFIAFVLCLTIFVAYTSVQASPEPKKIEQKEEKSQYFCDGLSLPKERQCPTMDDL